MTAPIARQFHSESPCAVWGGSTKTYQAAAAEALTHSGFEPSIFSWITPACGNELCIEPDHLRCYAPVKLAYPYGVCIYCGRHAATKDHLLPRNWTGDTRRHFTAIVPACGTCNSTLSDTLTWSITERRSLCHMRLRKKFAKVMKTIDFTEEELDEFGPSMRAYIVDALDKKAEVLRILAWPEDPTYDLRALERSGIENPYMIGLLLVDDPLADNSQEVVRAAGERFVNS